MGIHPKYQIDIVEWDIVTTSNKCPWIQKVHSWLLNDGTTSHKALNQCIHWNNPSRTCSSKHCPIMKGKMKCFVDPCSNHKHQGGFCGNVCVPCALLARDISRGKLNGHYYFQKGVVQFIADNWREVVKQSEDNNKG